MTDSALKSEVMIVSNNEATWEDLQAVLGGRGYASGLLVAALQEPGTRRRMTACDLDCII